MGQLSTDWRRERRRQRGHHRTPQPAAAHPRSHGERAVRAAAGRGWRFRRGPRARASLPADRRRLLVRGRRIGAAADARALPDERARRVQGWRAAVHPSRGRVRRRYVGGRMSVALTPWLSVRGDGRMLVERTTGGTAWDGSPALVLRPTGGLEIATGYRFGNLSDPDFSVRGGHGAFVTLSATITEKLFPTAAAFWRTRF